jgi:hypothetical protein
VVAGPPVPQTEGHCDGLSQPQPCFQGDRG